MKLITLEERKQIELDILQSVHDFCVSKGIKYSLACGTMLGAVRHKGFIPWDDDIDIYMLRDDYSAFEKEFPEMLRGKYTLASLSRTPGWHLSFGKVYDTRTVVVEHKASAAATGVSIDVFPLDEVPDDDSAFESYKRTLLRLYTKDWICRFKPNRHTGLIRNVAAVLMKLPLIFQLKEGFAGKIDSYARINNGKGYARVYECAEYPGPQIPFPKDFFGNLVLMPFEDREFYGFKNFDGYLTNTFGDYMTPPPVEKRTTYHVNDAFWK